VSGYDDSSKVSWFGMPNGMPNRPINRRIENTTMATLISRCDRNASGLRLVNVLLAVRTLLFPSQSRSRWTSDKYQARSTYGAKVNALHSLARKWSFRGALDRVMFNLAPTGSVQLMEWSAILEPVVGQGFEESEWLAEATELDARMLLNALIYYWNASDKATRSRDGFHATLGEALRASTVSGN
jgi:hypothetical protein